MFTLVSQTNGISMAATHFGTMVMRLIKERLHRLPSQIEQAENHWVIGKMKENQGGAESPSALLAQAHAIFISHYIEYN